MNYTFKRKEKELAFIIHPTNRLIEDTNRLSIGFNLDTNWEVEDQLVAKTPTEIMSAIRDYVKEQRDLLKESLSGVSVALFQSSHGYRAMNQINKKFENERNMSNFLENIDKQIEFINLDAEFFNKQLDSLQHVYLYNELGGGEVKAKVLGNHYSFEVTDNAELNINVSLLINDGGEDRTIQFKIMNYADHTNVFKSPVKLGRFERMGFNKKDLEVEMEP